MKIKDLKLDWQFNVPLAPFSTYQIGGKAKFFTVVRTAEQLQTALKDCYTQKWPYFILGKGSNILFDDQGYYGAIILNQIKLFELLDGTFHVGSGNSFSRLGIQTAKLGFSGLEYAIGIPGSVGGAVYMNAGANNQEVAPLITRVEFITDQGEKRTLVAKSLSFGYRRSCFHSMKGAIASVHLKLKPSKHARKKQLELIMARKKAQPLNQPSCGCVFRNFDDVSVGALIDQLGLKGIRVGGAQISEVHANFVVNAGSATAADVKELIELIEQKVFEKYHRKPEREVRYLPYDGAE